MILAARVLFVCLVASISSGTAFAQLFRTYLSFNGNDANPCTVQLPCRLLPAALTAVANGGEIWMLDSANYNTAPVNITKSVKILAIPGAMGSVVGNGGDAMVINAPGSNITLRNLVVLNFAGGINGIRILDAGAVHIEKLSIDGFNTDTSSCIQVSPAGAASVFVDDSFLRECRNGILAIGSAAGRPSVYVDNTRIERGLNTTGTTTTGVWMQGYVEVALRNSVILRATNAIQIDSLLDGLSTFLEVINSELHHNAVGLTFASTNTGAGRISIVHSQFLQNGDAILVSTGVGGAATNVKIADSHIAYTGNTGIQLSTANGIRFDLIRSEIAFSTTALNLIATGVGFVSANLRDSTISVASRGIVTSGAGSDIRVSLIRSDIHDIVGTAIDHGLGTVMLDGSQVSNCTDDFVNHGSGNIVSLGNNLVYNNINATPLTTYITPTVIVAE